MMPQRLRLLWAVYVVRVKELCYGILMDVYDCSALERIPQLRPTCGDNHRPSD